MAFSSDERSLCLGCKTLTLSALLSGFSHPLPYSEIAVSGQKCPLCKLIVCSMGRLQIESASSRIEKNYDSMLCALSELPAVYYRDFSGYPPICRQFVPPSYITWDRSQYRADPGNFDCELRKGNFDGGETIQVTADKSDCLNQQSFVSKRLINATDHQIRLLVQSCWASAAK